MLGRRAQLHQHNRVVFGVALDAPDSALVGAPAELDAVGVYGVQRAVERLTRLALGAFQSRQELLQHIRQIGLTARAAPLEVKLQAVGRPDL
jgi:hypothetical protein